MLLIDRPGVPATATGCSENNILGLVLGDNGPPALVENACANSSGGNPAIGGRLRPNSALNVVDGMPISGIWTFRLSDLATSDTGTFRHIGLSPSGVEPAMLELIFKNGFESE
jgi:hypothetical protein